MGEMPGQLEIFGRERFNSLFAPSISLAARDAGIEKKDAPPAPEADLTSTEAAVRVLGDQALTNSEVGVNFL